MLNCSCSTLIQKFTFTFIKSSKVLEGFGGVPPIRPLETLHNALSLKQLDGFLEAMITVPPFKTPASSPPTPIQTQQTLPDKIETLASKFEAEYL